MHDVSSLAWHQILDRHHTALAGELTAQLAVEVESRVAAERERTELSESQRAELLATLERERAENEAARERERAENDAAQARERLNIEARERLNSRRIAESLNQILRRIRQTAAEHETLQLVLEDSAGFSDSAVVVVIENNQASVGAWRGAAFFNEKFTEPERHEEEPEHPGSISLSDAPAIAACVESRDPVIAMMSAAEISPLLHSALSGTGADRAYLFPIAVRQTTVAMMIACGHVSPAPIELLCEAAGMKLETFELLHAVPATKTETLVQIEQRATDETAAELRIDAPPAAASQSESGATTWSKLTPEQQALHLRAQRTARVRVAQIRISESDALRAGVQAGNIYNAVRRSIDAARQEFHQAFMSESPTMVDYLHLEIVRSLAHDDIGLMGGDYPGPLI